VRVFRPPTVREGPAGPGALFGRYKFNEGITVLKNGTAYTQWRNPSSDTLAAATIAYRGGYEYEVDAAERAALIAAGYGAYVTGYGYGLGGYGQGPYGGEPALGYGEGGYGNEGGYGS